MSYKGDLIARSGGRFSDWAWSRRLSPRAVMVLATGWLLAVWVLGILLLQYGSEIEGYLFIMLLMPGNVLGTVGLGNRHGDAPPDEWQRARRDKAFMWGGNLTLAAIGLYTALATVLADYAWFWTPQTEDEWTVAFLLIVTSWMCLTTISAAWQTPSYAAELDEYE